MPLARSDIIRESDTPSGSELLARGAELARDWRVGPSAFLDQAGVASEVEYKRRQTATGRIMQHAQIGFRDSAKTERAWVEIHDACAAQGVTVDRYGICLDWSMGYPRDMRTDALRGTGLLLDDAEAFVALSAGAPVAPHFGDFVLGFPAAVENTCWALAAGATSIGNLGQYFTFRLPGWDDDVASTKATVEALGLIAAQDVPVLVHSNLDDGYAALFADLASSLGAVLIEKYIVEDLVGARVSHCYGHHFTDPVRRLGFHLALAQVTDTPGTMVYGNTVSYTGGDGANYASLSAYLLADIHGQIQAPTGHAINPVPVRENSRIPDIDEIIDAQLFAARMIEHGRTYVPLIDPAPAQALAGSIVEGGRRFFAAVLDGLRQAGIDTKDPFEMLLTLRRLGGRQLETLYGGKDRDGAQAVYVPSPVVEEVEEMAMKRLAHLSPQTRAAATGTGFKIVVATTDVHEHGKLVVERLLGQVGIETIDGGVSTDPDTLVRLAGETAADAIAVSTYNGIALAYVEAVFRELAAADLDIPLLVGGRLNQIPAGSNTSLPVDVTVEIEAAGAIVCRNAEDAVTALVDQARAPRLAGISR